MPEQLPELEIPFHSRMGTCEPIILTDFHFSVILSKSMLRSITDIDILSVVVSFSCYLNAVTYWMRVIGTVNLSHSGTHNLHLRVYAHYQSGY